MSITYTPGTAIDRGRALARGSRWGEGIHSCRARYEPNVNPGQDGWPASDHEVVRVEAWAMVLSDAGLAEVLAALLTFPGVIDSGTVTGHKDRRPYAWVLLPGDGSYCGHTRERWSKP